MNKSRASFSWSIVWSNLYDQAWNELNSAFFSSLLVISVTSIVFCAASLFFSIYSTSSIAFVVYSLKSRSQAIILLFLKHADRPISQVSLIKKESLIDYRIPVLFYSVVSKPHFLILSTWSTFCVEYLIELSAGGNMKIEELAEVYRNFNLFELQLSNTIKV